MSFFYLREFIVLASRPRVVAAFHWRGASSLPRVGAVIPTSSVYGTRSFVNGECRSPQRHRMSFALTYGRSFTAEAREVSEAEMSPKAIPEAEIGFSVADIRVGALVEAWEHEDSDKLFCELIDVGEERPRQIVSGLRAHYKLEDLDGVRCLVVCNLKKAKLAGVESNGMVLCGMSAEGKVEFVEPPANAAVGERAFCEGMEGEAMTPNQMKKKKAWEAVSPELKIVDGIATFKDIPIMTSAGPCKTRTIVEGPIA